MCLQDPCSLCDEAKEALDPLRHRVRAAAFFSPHVQLGLFGLWYTVTSPTSRALSLCLLVSLQFVLQLVDISLPENRTWFDRYRWDIPVFHLNGRFVMKHHVDLILLEQLLREAETNTT